MSTSRQALLSSQCILDLFPPFLSPFFQMDPGQTLWPFDVAFPSPNVGFFVWFFPVSFSEEGEECTGLGATWCNGRGPCPGKRIGMRFFRSFPTQIIL